MFSRQFTKDQDTWRRSRPEYAALLAAIKAGESNEALLELADLAGAYVNEVVELGRLRDRASSPNMRVRAGKFNGAQKGLATLNEKIGETDRAMNLAKTQLERDEFEGKLYGMLEKRQELQMQLADSSVAAGCVQAATLAGVI